MRYLEALKGVSILVVGVKKLSKWNLRRRRGGEVDRFGRRGERSGGRG